MGKMLRRAAALFLVFSMVLTMGMPVQARQIDDITAQSASVGDEQEGSEESKTGEEKTADA